MDEPTGEDRSEQICSCYLPHPEEHPYPPGGGCLCDCHCRCGDGGHW